MIVLIFATLTVWTLCLLALILIALDLVEVNYDLSKLEKGQYKFVEIKTKLKVDDQQFIKWMQHDKQ